MMVWEGISSEGTTDLRMQTAVMYQDEILGPTVRPYADSSWFNTVPGLTCSDCVGSSWMMKTLMH